MIVLVDSDILIEISRGRDQSILAHWEELKNSSSTLLYSPVSAAEIWAGARPNEFQATAEFFAVLQCATITYETGELAGKFLRQYAKSHGVELPDALIAASTQLHQALLWTRNRKHYPMAQNSFYA